MCAQFLPLKAPPQLQTPASCSTYHFSLWITRGRPLNRVGEKVFCNPSFLALSPRSTHLADSYSSLPTTVPFRCSPALACISIPPERGFHGMGVESREFVLKVRERKARCFNPCIDMRGLAIGDAQRVLTGLHARHARTVRWNPCRLTVNKGARALALVDCGDCDGSDPQGDRPAARNIGSTRRDGIWQLRVFPERLVDAGHGPPLPAFSVRRQRFAADGRILFCLFLRNLKKTPIAHSMR
jgi:hypothetical protein